MSDTEAKTPTNKSEVATAELISIAMEEDNNVNKSEKSSDTSSNTEEETKDAKQEDDDDKEKDKSESDENVIKTYTVKDGDTLTKIAAMHDTTPTKLAQFNKMFGAKMVFSGMVLKLPPPEPPKPPSPKPEPPKLDKDIVDISNKFVRLNCRHITEASGIVEGTILMTGKMVMFDPYGHHPLVLESGPDAYQIIMPFSLVANAAVLKDFIRHNSDNDPSLIHVPEEVKEVEAKEESTPEVSDDNKENKTENNSDDDETAGFMYLRIKMGQPLGGKIGRDEMINSYGEATVRPEYWFILTKRRADVVYNYFNKVDPEKYGVVNIEAIEKSGLELVREGREAVEAEAGRKANRATIAKLGKYHMSMASIDISMVAPMQGSSELMGQEERIYLAKMIPQKLDCHTWILMYSTSRDGFSLKNMMRKLGAVEGPVLMVLEDLKGNVFGAFLSEKPAFTEHFIGTGETFLFRLKPEIASYRWTGENNFFFRVDLDYICVGSSKGNFGLWIDKDLNNGRSQACATFDSEPLVSGEDFTLKTLECWSFEMEGY